MGNIFSSVSSINLHFLSWLITDHSAHTRTRHVFRRNHVSENRVCHEEKVREKILYYHETSEEEAAEKDSQYSNLDINFLFSLFRAVSGLLIERAS